VIVTEDDWASTVRPRLELAGADMDYVSVLCTDADGSGSPVFPRDIDIVLSTVPRPYLVVLDAWADTVEGHLSVKDGQQARQALHPWKEVATRLRAAVLLLTHTNRDGGTSIRARYALTSELRKKARMALFAQQDDNGRLVVGPDKSNLVGKVPAAVFSIEAVEVFTPTDSSDGTVPRLVFVETADYTAADLLAENAGGSGEKDTEGARGMAKVVLATVLADGQPHPAADVLAEVGKAGVSRSTAYRALAEMPIVHGRGGFPASATWQLVSQSSPSSETETTETTETTAGQAPPVVSVVSDVSVPADGTTTETDGTVEKRNDLDPNGWPYCAGGCGLGVNPAITDGDRHGFCS